MRPLIQDIHEALSPNPSVLHTTASDPDHRLHILLEDLLKAAYDCGKAGGDLIAFMHSQGLIVDRHTLSNRT